MRRAEMIEVGDEVGESTQVGVEGVAVRVIADRLLDAMPGKNPNSGHTLCDARRSTPLLVSTAIIVVGSDTSWSVWALW